MKSSQRSSQLARVARVANRTKRLRLSGFAIGLSTWRSRTRSWNNASLRSTRGWNRSKQKNARRFKKWPHKCIRSLSRCKKFRTRLRKFRVKTANLRTTSAVRLTGRTSALKKRDRSSTRLSRSSTFARKWPKRGTCAGPCPGTRLTWARSRRETRRQSLTTSRASTCNWRSRTRSSATLSKLTSYSRTQALQAKVKPTRALKPRKLHKVSRVKRRETGLKRGAGTSPAVSHRTPRRTAPQPKWRQRLRSEHQHKTQMNAFSSLIDLNFTIKKSFARTLLVPTTFSDSLSRWIVSPPLICKVWSFSITASV